MAETLEVLIKVAERKVEKAQQELAATRAIVARTEEEIVNLEREAAVAFVTAIAEDDVLAMQAASAFQERMRREVALRHAALQQMAELITTQEAALREVYAEQKRYELLWDKTKLERKKAREKKTQNALDEVAGQVRR
jgi:flagellar biosynthesis chaperone FliJ